MRLRRLMAASMAGVMAVSSAVVCQITAGAINIEKEITGNTDEWGVTNFDLDFDLGTLSENATLTIYYDCSDVAADAYPAVLTQFNAGEATNWGYEVDRHQFAQGTNDTGTFELSIATLLNKFSTEYPDIATADISQIRLNFWNGAKAAKIKIKDCEYNITEITGVKDEWGMVNCNLNTDLGSYPEGTKLVIHYDCSAVAADAYPAVLTQFNAGEATNWGYQVDCHQFAQGTNNTGTFELLLSDLLATFSAEYPDIATADISQIRLAFWNGATATGVDIKAPVTDVAVTDVSLDKPTLALKAGGTSKLTATVTPENATDPTVTWTSSDPTVATVEDGVVTAVKAGTATITAAAGDKTATCAVTVTPATYTVTVGTTTNGTVTADTAETTAGTKVQLTVTPAADYELDTLTVKNGTTAVTVAADYSFTMPAGNVTIAATFKAIPHNITTSSTNGTITVAKTAVKGASVTITPVPTSGYELDTLTVTGKTSGKAVTVTNNAFTMPAEDVVIKATFKKTAATIVSEAAAKVTENMNNIVADNDTTDQDVLDAINGFINNNAVTSSWDTKNPFNKKESTTSATGSITGTVNLQSSGVTTGVAVKVEIAKIPVTDADKVAAAKKNAQKALNSITATNAITSDTILAAVNKNISSTGVTAAISGFKVTKATSSAVGSVTGTITLTSGNVSDTLAINLPIAMTEKTDAEKLAEAKTAAQKIFNAAKSAADITEAKIVAAINNTEVAVVFNTTTVDSTTTTEGSTTVTAALSVGNESTTVTRSFTIPKKETTPTDPIIPVDPDPIVPDEPDPILPVVPKNEIKELYTGTTALGTDWSKSVTVPKADVKVGDTIRIKVGIGSADYHQVKIMNSDWKELTSPDGVNEWGCIDVSEDGYVTFVLNAADAKAISEGGLIISGYDATITGVDAVLMADKTITPSTKVETVMTKTDSQGNITEQYAVFAISEADAANYDDYAITITRSSDSKKVVVIVDECFRYVTYNDNGKDVRVSSNGAYTILLDITGISSNFGTLTINISPVVG